MDGGVRKVTDFRNSRCLLPPDPGGSTISCKARAKDSFRSFIVIRVFWRTSTEDILRSEPCWSGGRSDDDVVLVEDEVAVLESLEGRLEIWRMSFLGNGYLLRRGMSSSDMKVSVCSDGGSDCCVRCVRAVVWKTLAAALLVLLPLLLLPSFLVVSSTSTMALS